MMQRICRILVLLTSICVGSCLPTFAGAAAQADAEAGIEELVVTARRREESVQSVPIPVTVVSGDALKNRAAEDIRDLTRITPNLNFQQAGSAKNTAQVFLRGIGQVNWSPTQDPKIGIYLNGVYLGRPQGGVFDLLDVKRVEVLRGPQGTLFGRNTTAGLVHVITNNPVDEFDYNVTGGFGKDGGLKGEFMVNVPVSDTLALRLAMQHRESDGFVRNTGTGEDWNDENAQHARLSFRWTPIDPIKADLILEYQRVRENPGLGSCEWGQPDNGADATGFFPRLAFIFGVYDEIRDTCNATRPYRSSENDPAESNVDAWGITLDLNIDLGWGGLTSITAFREVEDFNSSWGWGSDTPGTASFLEVHGVDDNESSQWSQELRLAATALDGDLNWVVGVYAFEEDAVNSLDVPIFRGVVLPDCTVWPVPCIPDPATGTLGQLALGAQLFGSRYQNVDATNSSQAIFGEVSWRFSEDWTVTAGARFSRDDREFTRTHRLTTGIPDPALTCPPGTPPPVNGTVCRIDKQFSELTPRVIVSRDINDDMMLYLGWSKGYSSGGFNQDVRMRAFDPEISGNWEGGMKSTWLNNRLLLNLTAFRNNYENQQITVSRLVGGVPTADLINAREATLYGLEGEFRAELPANWYIQGSFGWLNGDYDEFTIQDNQSNAQGEEMIVTRDLSATEIVRGAPYTYSIAAGRSQVFNDGSRLDGQVGWAFRGRGYSTLETLRSSRQGKYGLLDARFVWTLANGQTSIALWGSNLLDRQYFNAAIDLTGGLNPTGTNTRYWAEPRRYGIEFTHRMSN